MARLFRGADRRLRLAIHDTGIGIGDAFLSKVGEPFSQEQSGFTRHFEGCGLGLALTKRYLELNQMCIRDRFRAESIAILTAPQGIRASSMTSIGDGVGWAPRRAHGPLFEPLAVLTSVDNQL